jgi:archaellum component FlaC
VENVIGGEKLDRIADKIDLIRDDIAEIKVDLATHILRTRIAEENIEILRNELRPVEKHVEQMQGALNLVKILSVVLGVVLAVAGVVALVKF